MGFVFFCSSADLASTYSYIMDDELGAAGAGQKPFQPLAQVALGAVGVGDVAVRDAVNLKVIVSVHARTGPSTRSW